MMTEIPFNRQRSVLDRLIQERGLKAGAYALFWVTGEGDFLPDPDWDDIEETSGFVIDQDGRTYEFWLGWDPHSRCPALTEWREVTPEPDWSADEEYLEARREIGLSAA